MSTTSPGLSKRTRTVLAAAAAATVAITGLSFALQPEPVEAAEQSAEQAQLPADPAQSKYTLTGLAPGVYTAVDYDYIAWRDANPQDMYWCQVTITDESGQVYTTKSYAGDHVNFAVPPGYTATMEGNCPAQLEHYVTGAIVDVRPAAPTD